MGAKAKKYRGHALPARSLAERVGLWSSGASGVHEDQKARVHRTGRTNRVGSRSSRTRAAIRTEAG
jgi:hypothetical protein